MEPRNYKSPFGKHSSGRRLGLLRLPSFYRNIAAPNSVVVYCLSI